MNEARSTPAAAAGHCGDPAQGAGDAARPVSERAAQVTDDFREAADRVKDTATATAQEVADRVKEQAKQTGNTIKEQSRGFLNEQKRRGRCQNSDLFGSSLMRSTKHGCAAFERCLIELACRFRT